MGTSYKLAPAWGQSIKLYSIFLVKVEFTNGIYGAYELMITKGSNFVSN